MATLTEVVAAFEASADPKLVARCRRLVRSGRARWEWDPYVDNTVGLVRTLLGDRRRAYVVVYDLGADFEVAEELA